MGNKFSTKQVLIATTFFQSVSATTSLKSPLTTRFYNSAWDPAGTPLQSSVLKFMEKKLFISNSLKSSSGSDSRSQAKLFPISISKKKKDQIFTFLFFFPKKTRRGKLASEKFKLLRFWINRRTDEMECVCASVSGCVCEWSRVWERWIRADVKMKGHLELASNLPFSSFASECNFRSACRR